MTSKKSGHDCHSMIFMIMEQLPSKLRQQTSGWLIMLFLLVTPFVRSMQPIYAAVNASSFKVTSTLGTTSATYSTLKAVFDKINNGTHKGEIIIVVQASSVETATSALYASGYGKANYTSVRIYPSAIGLSISGNISDKGLIYLDGADKVSINGSLNGNGNTAELCFVNTSGPIYSFNNGASNNSIRYAKLQAAGTSTGIINTPNDKQGNNDNDSIISCYLSGIASNRPMAALKVEWTGTSTFNGLTILNNRFFDLWNASATSYGIYMNTSGSYSGVTISGNHFYETSAINPQGGYSYYHIYLSNTSSNDYTITDNSFGGSAPECGGTPLQLGLTGSSNSIEYNPIYLNIGNSFVSNIGYNQIRNIALSTAGQAAFKGIYVYKGNVRISNNILGASIGTNAIQLTGTGGTCNSYGIYANQSSSTIINSNAVGSVTTNHTNGYGHSFCGIYKETWDSGLLEINDNLIGSTVTPNSIQCISTAYQGSSQQVLTGISAGSNLGSTVTGNTVGYLSNFSTGNSSSNYLYGIYLSANGDNTIDKNFVLHLYATFSGSSSILSGIYVNKGHNTLSNNIIYVGEDITSGAFPIYGIADFNDEGVDGYYQYNTGYLCGTVTGSSTANSSAFYKARWGETVHLTNNIFMNIRTGGGTLSGEHSAINIDNSNMTSLVLSESNNLYVAPNSLNSYLGSLGGNNYTTLVNWSSATNGDEKSSVVDPVFVSVGNDATGFIPTASLKGTDLNGSDYGESDRPATPTMGAWETENSSAGSGTGTVQVYIGNRLKGVYPTLKAAFDKINIGLHTGNLTIKLTGSTTETETANLKASGSGNASYSGITIFPTKAGLHLSGNLGSALIKFNGADRVVVDGRVNATGNAVDLTIINSSTDSEASTIEFTNSAQNNTVQYCAVQGAGTGMENGVLAFTYTDGDVGSGSSGNTVANNIFSGLTLSARPINMIYSKGALNYNNDHMVINGNQIRNSFNPAHSSNGLFADSYSSDWTITDNSFFETETITQTVSGTLTFSAIRIDNNLGKSFRITGNHIGGTEAELEGSTMTVGSSSSQMNTRIVPIYVNVGTIDTSFVNGNAIGNMVLYSSASSDFTGIDVEGGLVRAGSSDSGNRIGGTQNKAVTIYNAGSGSNTYGLYINSNAPILLTANQIQGLKVNVNNTNRIHTLSGIYINTAGVGTVISQQFIQGLNVVNANKSSIVQGIHIQAGSGSAFNNLVVLGSDVSLGCNIYGIKLFTGGNYTILHNTLCINGSASNSGTNKNTASFRDDQVNGTLQLKNNLLINTRQTGSGSHYAVSLSATSNLTIDGNDYYSETSSHFLGYLNSQVTSLQSWIKSTKQDANSISLNPTFEGSTTSEPSGYRPVVPLNGLPGTGVLVDLLGVIRPAEPTIGALEMFILQLSWTGNLDSDWNKSANWQPQVVPTLTLPVLVSHQANQPVIFIGTDAVALSLLIQAGAILTVNGGASLQVTETIDNQNDTDGLVIQSTAEGTGSLLHSTANVPATVKRYIPGTEAPWYFLSSPIASQAIFGTEWTPSGNYGDGTGYDLNVWDEGSSCWIYNLNNVTTESTPTWSEAHPESYFVPGRGYLYATLEENPTKSFAGILNNGDIGRNLSRGSSSQNLAGFNLLGNPYPSSIDWCTNIGFDRGMLTMNGSGYDLWIWSQSANNYGIYNSGDADGTGTNNVSRYIAPMQGFMVLTNQDGTFTFHNEARVNDGASIWMRSENTFTSSPLKLSVLSEAETGSDEIRILFGTKENQSGSLKLFSPVETAPSLYLPDQGCNYSVLRLAESASIIPVSFQAGNNGRFTIHADLNPSDTATIYLQDKQTETIVCLNETDSYTFSASDQDKPGRFALHFGVVTPDDDVRNAAVYTSNGHLTVNLSELHDTYTTQVHTLDGILLKQFRLKGGESVTLELKTRGVYLVTLTSENEKLTKKVVY